MQERVWSVIDREYVRGLVETWRKGRKDPDNEWLRAAYLVAKATTVPLVERDLTTRTLLNEWFDHKFKPSPDVETVDGLHREIVLALGMDVA